MARSKSSARWLKEHFSDPYVKQAQKEGYRSRAVFKLMEIQDRTHFIKPGMTVVDLGAAPGGWSQILRQWVGKKGRVIALDILPMEPLPNVEFIQGDFAAQEVLDNLLHLLKDRPVDVVISDMAPNLSGTDAIDQPRSIYLAELALEFAQQVLRPGGDYLTKLFQGVGSEAYLKLLRTHFTKVVTRKPKASRARSNEVYLLARGFNPK